MIFVVEVAYNNRVNQYHQSIDQWDHLKLNLLPSHFFISGFPPMSTKSVEWRISLLLWNLLCIWIETQFFCCNLNFPISTKKQNASVLALISEPTKHDCNSHCARRLSWNLVTPDLSPVKNGSPRLVLPINTLEQEHHARLGIHGFPCQCPLTAQNDKASTPT